MANNLYKQYLRLLQKWPVDPNKSEGLAQHIREQVKISFIKGERSEIKDKEKCQRYYDSLDRLANNYYAKKYPIPKNFTKTASGLTPEQCSVALSKDFLEQVQLQKKGFFGKLKDKIKTTFIVHSNKPS